MSGNDNPVINVASNPFIAAFRLLENVNPIVNLECRLDFGMRRPIENQGTGYGTAIGLSAAGCFFVHEAL
jgi:hypothetical protein